MSAAGGRPHLMLAMTCLSLPLLGDILCVIALVRLRVWLEKDPSWLQMK